MDIKKAGWMSRSDFAMLSVWILTTLSLASIAFASFGMDFRGYYAATRVLLSGGNPYDYHLVSRVLLDVTGEMGNNPYYYPPWFAWLFIPLAPLPFQSARLVWMSFNVILWVIGLWKLSKMASWPKRGWPQYTLFTLATFSFAWITWRYEQAGILVFAILLAFIISTQNQNPLQSGVWLALLLIKPNVTLIIVAGISLWLIRKGQWRIVAVMSLIIVILLALSTWITPDWFRPFLEDGFGQGLTVALDGPAHVVALRINTTFPDWLRTLGIGPSLRMLVYGLVICVGTVIFFWSVYRSESLIQLVSILLLVSYAITPYALQYDYPPLVIVLFWALSRCVSSPGVRGVGLILAAFIFSVIFWQQNISWAYWMVIGLIALLIWSLRQRTLQSLNQQSNDFR